MKKIKHKKSTEISKNEREKTYNFLKHYIFLKKELKGGDDKLKQLKSD